MLDSHSHGRCEDDEDGNWSILDNQLKGQHRGSLSNQTASGEDVEPDEVQKKRYNFAWSLNYSASLRAQLQDN